MKITVRQIFRLHIFFLFVTVSNWIVELSTNYGLTNVVEAVFESLLILSGLALFFFHLNPVKQFNLYFYIFPVWVLLVSIGSILKGTFGEIILVLLLGSIWPDNLEVKKGPISIYDNAQGFMAMCCPYKMTEQRLFFFEKDLGEFELIETIDPNSVEIENSADMVRLEFTSTNSLNKEIIEIKKYGN